MPTVAAIDAGSSAIRLAMVEVGPTGIAKQREVRRYPFRLGAGVFASGHICPESIDELVRIFEDVVKRMQRAGVSRYRAVATSAMRDAVNGGEVADDIRKRTGLELEVISGAEEGRIMRLTLMRALGSLSSDCLLVDLGGGSLEVGRTTEPDATSLPLGTVRLLHRYPALLGKVDRDRLDEVVKAVAAELGDPRAQPGATEVAIGTGGNLDALARLVPVKAAVPAIDVTKLPAFAARLARMPVDERVHRFGLRRDRADLIVPAAIVILALVAVYQLRLVVVPGTGIRESILYTLVAESTRPSRARDLLRAQSFDLSQPDRRVRMSRRLFELLARQHALWPPAAVPLEAAAYLFAGTGGHAAADIVPSAVQLLLTSPELDLDDRARTVAAYALGEAQGVPVRAGRIGPADRDVARVLGAILRLAEALIEASDAWEPRVDLMREPIGVEVGLRRPLARRDVRPLEQVIGRRIKVT
jgi:exopolyphosphatase/guanosine-5'-triphosphate,3'-diphosphate pyrophosphatase